MAKYDQHSDVTAKVFCIDNADTRFRKTKPAMPTNKKIKFEATLKKLGMSQKER